VAAFVSARLRLSACLRWVQSTALLWKATEGGARLSPRSTTRPQNGVQSGVLG
jgi:hypothetical protein